MQTRPLRVCPPIRGWGERPLLSPRERRARTQFVLRVYIVQNHARTVGITFSSYTKSGVQAGSAARSLRAQRALECWLAGMRKKLIVQHTQTHAHNALCSPDVVPWPSKRSCEIIKISATSYAMTSSFSQSNKAQPQRTQVPALSTPPQLREPQHPSSLAAGR